MFQWIALQKDDTHDVTKIRMIEGHHTWYLSTPNNLLTTQKSRF